MYLKRYFKISRPHFWLYELGTFAVGVAAAAASGVSIPWTLALLFGLFFLYPANIYIYGINDIFDYETDKLNPKKVAYEALVVPEEHSRLAFHILIVCLPFLALAIFSLPFSSYAAFLLFFFFAGFYSAPPIRAKARPVLDSFFSAAHYVVTGVFAYLLVLPHASIHSLLAPTVAGLCWAIAMHAYSAVPDIKADSDAHLKTIATALGAKSTILLCALLYAASAALVFSYEPYLAILGGVVYVSLMIVSLLRFSKLFSIYKTFAYINAIFGAIVFFSLLF